MSEQQNEETQQVTSEIIEIEWEEISQIHKLREELTNIETHFSTMCLNFEKRKLEIMNMISSYESSMINLAKQLRTEKDISEDVTYELKLPVSEGEKGYFIRKDQ